MLANYGPCLYESKVIANKNKPVKVVARLAIKEQQIRDKKKLQKKLWFSNIG